MRGILARLFRSRRQPPVTCYQRENGPIAYEFLAFRSPREGAEALLSSPLIWAWRGSARDWTELTRVSLPAFVSDVGTGVLMVGVAQELPNQVTDAIVAGWLRRFCRDDALPVAVVVRLTGRRQILFVPQHPSAAAADLLDALGLDRQAAVRSSYGRLGADSLEALAGTLSR